MNSEVELEELMATLDFLEEEGRFYQYELKLESEGL